MSVIGEQAVMPLGNIHVHSIEGNGANFTTAGGSLTTAASAAWPGTNRGHLSFFAVQTPIVVTQLFCYNGATVSGNVDMAILDSTGRRIVSTGSTAQSGTNQLQVFDITDTTLFPDLYTIVLSCDNTTATFFRVQFGNSFVHLGVASLGVASAFPVPASIVFGLVNADYMPLMGMTIKTVV